MTPFLDRGVTLLIIPLSVLLPILTVAFPPTDIYVINSVKNDVMRIANSAYYTGPGDYNLFVANGNGEIVKRKVKLGEAGFDYVEVVSGLKPGDRVVVSDMNDYKDKSRLKVKK